MHPQRPSSPARVRHRWRRVLLGAGLVLGPVVLLASGWMLANVFESPQQREAVASAPTPGDVTAEVTFGPLADTVTVNVEVTRAGEIQVPISAAGGLAVITGRPVADGGTLKLGRSVLEVNGRPLILITGRFPMFRDLTEGLEGPDVRQLQKALMSAGYAVEVDGRFGAGTTQAIRALYRHLDYPVPESVRASEFVVVPKLPAQLTTAPPLGAAGEGAIARIATGGLVASASLPSSVAERLSMDLPVTLRGTDGVDTPARISSVGGVDSESGEATLTLVPAGDPFPTDLLGETRLAVITIELVEAEALLVPSVAVSPRGTAAPVVVRIDDDGSRHEVRVRELGVLAGVSAVEPVDVTELTVGDLVKVD